MRARNDMVVIGWWPDGATVVYMHTDAAACQRKPRLSTNNTELGTRPPPDLPMTNNILVKADMNNKWAYAANKFPFSLVMATMPKVAWPSVITDSMIWTLMDDVLGKRGSFHLLSSYSSSWSCPLNPPGKGGAADDNVVVGVLSTCMDTNVKEGSSASSLASMDGKVVVAATPALLLPAACISCFSRANLLMWLIKWKILKKNM